MLTAALDAARLGARAPLSADLLRAAAPGYCTSQQQAEAPDNWFEQALAYATGKLHGAAAALSPAGAGMGQVAGYTVADYLIQHASRERRYARVPASTWDALLSHIRDPADAARLADSARTGCCTATPSRCTVTPPTPATGTPPCGWPTCWPSAATWTRLRARRRRRRPGRRRSAGRAAGRARRPGRAARPRRRRRRARRRALADLLAERGDLDELRARGRRRRRGTPPSGWPTCWPSAGTWTGRQSCAPGPTPATGSPPSGWPTCWPSAGTWTSRRSCAPAPTPATGRRLAAGRPAGQARRPGRGCAPAPTPATGTPPGSWPTCWPERGDLDGLRARGRRRRPVRRLSAGRPAGRARRPGRAARPGRRRRRDAAERLADLLAERGDLDELRARADAGDGDAAKRLADLLAERGDLDGLRARADAGDGDAAERLADLLAERGDLDELRARADAGDAAAAARAGRAAGQARGPGRGRADPARPGRRR